MDSAEEVYFHSESNSVWSPTYSGIMSKPCQNYVQIGFHSFWNNVYWLLQSPSFLFVSWVDHLQVDCSESFCTLCLSAEHLAPNTYQEVEWCVTLYGKWWPWTLLFHETKHTTLFGEIWTLVEGTSVPHPNQLVKFLVVFVLNIFDTIQYIIFLQYICRILWDVPYLTLSFWYCNQFCLWLAFCR